MMFELQSCKIIERETEKIDRNFYVNSATYQSTFVDKNNEEYVYTGELILCNKVVSLSDLTDLSYVYSMLKKHNFLFMMLCSRLLHHVSIIY
jgi:hypothetical protein